MRCPRCGFENPAGAKFCEECGAKQGRVCPACGQEAGASAKFCSECGALLTAPSNAPATSSAAVRATSTASSTPIDYTPPYLAERILAAQAEMEARRQTDGERKMVTALFADMAGSTALIHDLDPDDARRLIDPVLALMMEAVHHYEGYVAKSMGDGILALFARDRERRPSTAGLAGGASHARGHASLRRPRAPRPRHRATDPCRHQLRRSGSAHHSHQGSAYRLRPGRQFDPYCIAHGEHRHSGLDCRKRTHPQPDRRLFLVQGPRRDNNQGAA